MIAAVEPGSRTDGRGIERLRAGGVEVELATGDIERRARRQNAGFGGAEPDGGLRARARRHRHRRGLARAPGIAARRGERPGRRGRRLRRHRLRQPRAVRTPRPHAALLRRPDRCQGCPRGGRGDRPRPPHRRTGHRAVARGGRRGGAGHGRHRAPGPPPERRVSHAGATGAPARHLQGRRQHRRPRGRPRRRAALDLLAAEPGAGARVAGRSGRSRGRHRHRTCRRSDSHRARLRVPRRNASRCGSCSTAAARLPVGSALVRSAGEGPVAVVCRPGAPGIADLVAAGVEAIEASDAGQALAELGRRGVATVLLEGGATLAAALRRRRPGRPAGAVRGAAGAGCRAERAGGLARHAAGRGGARAQQPPGRPGYAAGGRRARGSEEGGDVHRDRDRAGRGGRSHRPGCGCARPGSPPTPRSATRWPWTAAA